jgi:ABC-2 type transport system ATP-binding protein
MIGVECLSDTIREEYWSRFSNSYDRKQEYVVGRELLDDITQELQRLPGLGEGVEFGCGTGFFTKRIVAKTKSLLATDLSDSLLKVAMKRLGDQPKVRFQKENCMATSFSREVFDSIFMANLLHVVERPKATLQECHRIIRINGIIVIVTFTGYSMKLWEKIKMGVRFSKAWGRPPAHANSFSVDDIAKMMEETGFALKTVKVIGVRTKALFAIGRKAGDSA